MQESWIIPADIFDRMAACAEADFPEETCGLVFGPDDDLEVVPMENIQNRLHREDPENYPRDARRAYHFDSIKLDRLRRQKKEAGRPLRAIYHSHPDEDAYFSKKDRADAAPPGWGPLFPGAVYVVFSVRDGKVVDTAGFTWSDDAGDFVEIAISREEAAPD